MTQNKWKKLVGCMVSLMLMVSLTCSVVPAQENAGGEIRYGIATYSADRVYTGTAHAQIQTSKTQQAFSEEAQEYYGQQLDAAATILYNFLKDNVEKMYDGCTEIEQNVEKGTLTFDDCNNGAYQYAVDAFRADHPEVFWLDFTKISLGYMSYSGSRYIDKITLSPQGDSYYSTADANVIMNNKMLHNYGGATPFTDEASCLAALDKFNGQVDACLAATASCKNDYEKVKVINDWLADHITYDYDYFDQSPYAALVYGRGVCAGYVTAFQTIARKAGITTVQVCGLAHSTATQSENHAWNLVMLDGNWYALDITWNDPQEGGTPYTDFFLVGSSTPASILEGNITFEASHEQFNYFSSADYPFVTPVLSKTAFVYTGDNGQSGSNTDDNGNDNPNPPVTGEAVRGDVDLNQQVNLNDAQLVLKAALKIITLGEQEMKNAEVTGDGIVDLADAQLILKAALQIIKL